MHLLKSLCLLLLAVLLYACKTDYTALPTYTPTKQLQAVIETPAGNNHKLVYNQEKQEFVRDQDAGLDRVVPFLPYPANLGFIPSTEINKSGKGLEILVLSERLETGAVVEVVPVGLLQLETAGELQHIVVAVPARPSERQIQATNYASLSADYSGVKTILATWFTHSSPGASTKFVGWRDERFADKEIQRWMKL
ncbi:inorganic pyrophosphatase [Pontibacter ummariensis]|uniref:inorganic diphosphatase n=1 Tax=Pontibacter ummariensis TaxID=1610492 RepID=A0A239BCD0_9BACT|nr:inorganic diphosphatase [Pontibacter ummariensis]PRY16449.1 inorganic pyrophosphatase [Pontibacter ummariensis]SNS05349.1 inorganic pyrophosphatase [Pontibacter ummariensis]